MGVVSPWPHHDRVEALKVGLRQRGRVEHRHLHAELRQRRGTVVADPLDVPDV
jgi:hypothetical protein